MAAVRSPAAIGRKRRNFKKRPPARSRKRRGEGNGALLGSGRRIPPPALPQFLGTPSGFFLSNGRFARRVFAFGAGAGGFAGELRAKGIDATALQGDQQLSLL